MANCTKKGVQLVLSETKVGYYQILRKEYFPLKGSTDYVDKGTADTVEEALDIIDKMVDDIEAWETRRYQNGWRKESFERSTEYKRYSVWAIAFGAKR